MINPMIAALASEAAAGELQNAKVGSGLSVRVSALRVHLGKASKAIDSISAYKIGDGRESLSEIEEYVRQSQYNEQDRAAMAEMLAAVVGGGGSKDSKAFACRQLWLIGTPAEVPVLAAALNDPVLNDMARYALQNLESPEVDAALIAALDSTEPAVLIGVINSLTMRKSPGALDAIKPLKKSKDKVVAAAAKHAIGRLEGKIVP